MNIAENVDCMEAMKKLPDKAFNLAVVDPPYFSGPERRGYYGCKVSKIGVHRDYPISPKWDLSLIHIFTVPHIRYTKKGSVALTDPRDIYEIDVYKRQTLSYVLFLHILRQVQYFSLCSILRSTDRASNILHGL